MGSTMMISGCAATEDKSKETVRNPPTGAQTRSAGDAVTPQVGGSRSRARRRARG